MSPIFVLLVVTLVVVSLMLRRPTGLSGPVDTESLIHRCDFCKEAILPIDHQAKCFVRHAKGERALLGYRVLNACGACVREGRLEGAFSSERAEPPS
ncbi:MAG: hypothetical protein QOH48_1502 [Actinomycetota bacterium]|nr:hypothetical protein [Actinomycetota bacterium]